MRLGVDGQPAEWWAFPPSPASAFMPRLLLVRPRFHLEGPRLLFIRPRFHLEGPRLLFVRSWTTHRSLRPVEQLSRGDKVVRAGRAHQGAGEFTNSPLHACVRPPPTEGPSNLANPWSFARATYRRDTSSTKSRLSTESASARNAARPRSSNGSDSTHCLTGTAGSTRSTRWAAASDMRRPAQLGQAARPLHEKATRRSWPHASQWHRTKPCAKTPQRR